MTSLNAHLEEIENRWTFKGANEMNALAINADFSRLLKALRLAEDGLEKAHHAAANAWEWQCSDPEDSEMDRDQQIGNWCEKACGEIKEARTAMLAVFTDEK